MQEQSYGVIPFLRELGEWKVFLIHQYGSGGDMLWTFPKGRGEVGETPRETALRELREETGLTPASLDEVHPLSTSYAFERRGVRVEKTSTYFIGIIEDAAFVVQEEEVREAGWFTLDAARAQLTFPDYKALLDTAMQLLDK